MATRQFQAEVKLVSNKVWVPVRLCVYQPCSPVITQWSHVSTCPCGQQVEQQQQMQEHNNTLITLSF